MARVPISISMWSMSSATNVGPGTIDRRSLADAPADVGDVVVSPDETSSLRSDVDEFAVGDNSALAGPQVHGLSGPHRTVWP